MDADVVIPWIDVSRDTGAFVKALIDAPAGLQVVGASEYLSARQWLQLWSAHTGIKAAYELTTLEEFSGHDPTGLMREVGELLMYIEEFGFDGGDPNILTADQVGSAAAQALSGDLTDVGAQFEEREYPIPRTKIAEHIRHEDWSKFQ